MLAPRSTFWSRGRLLRRRMNIFDGLMAVGNPLGIRRLEPYGCLACGLTPTFVGVTAILAWAWSVDSHRLFERLSRSMQSRARTVHVWDG